MPVFNARNDQIPVFPDESLEASFRRVELVKWTEVLSLAVSF